MSNMRDEMAVQAAREHEELMQSIRVAPRMSIFGPLDLPQVQAANAQAKATTPGTLPQNTSQVQPKVADTGGPGRPGA